MLYWIRLWRLITLQNPFVFPSSNSKSGHLEYPKRAWYRALKEAGITDLHIHDLKRTCGTRLKELKVDSEAVKTILAHADYRTSEPYIHVKDTVREAIELLGITYFGEKSDEKTAWLLYVCGIIPYKHSSRRSDLNRWPALYERAALPLSYVGWQRVFLEWTPVRIN